MSELAKAVAVVLACAAPLLLTLWALLDAARRPDWVWALAGRRRVVWLAAILFGAMTVVVGLAVSLAYLLRVRPDLTATETGQIDVGDGRRDGAPGPNRSAGGGP
jgi:hypothetical protein